MKGKNINYKSCIPAKAKEELTQYVVFLQLMFFHPKKKKEQEQKVRFLAAAMV